MIIDFHTHSNASDGALSPEDLVKGAIAAGVSQFAITDHDTVAGYTQACALMPQLPVGFSLIAGVELSCRWSNTTIHVVGLGIDIEHSQMRSGIEEMCEARLARAGMISQRLEKSGFEGALDGAMAMAGDSQIGRPHFARWLLQQGHVRDLDAAYDKHLGAGRPGDVKAFWPELESVTQWIVAAGGVAVLAHPMKYKLTRMKLRRLLQDFVSAGGSGLEIFSGRQLPEHMAALCQLAEEFKLKISAGSDFHKAWQYGPSIGVNVERFPQLPSLWQAGGVV